MRKDRAELRVYASLMFGEMGERGLKLEAMCDLHVYAKDLPEGLTTELNRAISSELKSIKAKYRIVEQTEEIFNTYTREVLEERKQE
jgi:hypothetical protein